MFVLAVKEKYCMPEILTYSFFQNALLASFFISIACAIMGSLAMANKLLPMAGGITHGAFGGIGLAFYFSLPVFLSTVSFTIILALVLAYLSLKYPHRSDNLVAVIWTFGMALGLILIDLSPSYQNDLFAYLFGSILTISFNDIYALIFADILFILFVSLFYRQLIAISFDIEFANLKGVNTNLFYYTLLCLISLCIVLCMSCVGLILIIALLSIPSFIAEKFTKSLAATIFLAFILSFVFCLSGIFISYYLNLSSSASIIAVACLGFFISLLLKSLINFSHKQSGY